MSDEYVEEVAPQEAPVEATQEVENVEQQENEPQEETPEQIEAKKQDNVNQAINKQHKKFRDEERSHAETKERLKALEDQAATLAPQQPTIPDIPDAFADNVDQLNADRDKAISDLAIFNNQQAVLQQNQHAAQQTAAREQQVVLQGKLDTYNENAKKNGVSPEQLKEAGAVVGGYNLSNDLTMAILSDPDGALITSHLAANPMVLDELSRLNSYEAAMFIERNVRSKAQELKPRTTNAPKPAQQLQGNGVDKDLGQYKNIKGATFT